jgi:succinate dehydrogenase / fumarate reductase cytochrome b subunit
MLERSRPLSPFLHYRWQYTNTLSILHRITGVVLSFGYLVLVYWIIALARGAAAYERAQATLGHPVFRVLLALALIAFAYHFCSGVRHLFFDAGIGLERREARRSAWIVGLGTVLLAATVACVLVLGRGAR